MIFIILLIILSLLIISNRDELSAIWSKKISVRLSEWLDSSEIETLPPEIYQQEKLLTALPYDKGITPKSKRSIEAFNRHQLRLIREFSAKGLHFGSPVFMRLFKQSKTLEIWVKEPNKGTFKLFKTYPIATFSGTLGPKFAEGDRQSPEGFYFVPASMMNPNSRFHLSFNLGFPNDYDKANHRTGSALMAHGNRVSIGCYAMTDKLIEEIYTIADAALGSGQTFFRVHIFPFRLTDNELAKHQQSPHFDFWKNLQVGYRWFENSKILPNVSVKNQQYLFSN